MRKFRGENNLLFASIYLISIFCIHLAEMTRLVNLKYEIFYI